MIVANCYHGNMVHGNTWLYYNSVQNMMAHITDDASFCLTGAKEFKCGAISCGKKFHSEHRSDFFSRAYKHETKKG